MGKLLSLQQPPTAVFCYNDLTALGAYGELRARGLRIPDDISVAGFDDLFFTPYLHQPLTTIRQPMHEMGRRAMYLLLELLKGRPSERTIKVDGELMVRESTAPPKGT